MVILVLKLLPEVATQRAFKYFNLTAVAVIFKI